MVQACTDGNVAWAATHVQEAVLRSCIRVSCCTSFAKCVTLRVMLPVLCPPTVLEALVWSCISGHTTYSRPRLMHAVDPRALGAKHRIAKTAAARACVRLRLSAALKQEARLAQKAMCQSTEGCELENQAVLCRRDVDEGREAPPDVFGPNRYAQLSGSYSVGACRAVGSARTVCGLRAVCERVHSTCVRGAVGSGRTFRLLNSHRFGSDRHCR